jgi:hypothetical protein
LPWATPPAIGAKRSGADRRPVRLASARADLGAEPIAAAPRPHWWWRHDPRRDLLEHAAHHHPHFPLFEPKPD